MLEASSDLPDNVAALQAMSDRPVNALYRGDGMAGYAADAA